MRICLAGVLGIEPRTTESKSVVIPLHYTPTKSRIVKEHFSTMAYKTKNPLDFHLRGFGKYTGCISYLLAKPLESFSIAYPNTGREHVQPLDSGRCICLDMFLKFMIEFYYTFGYLSSTIWNNLTSCRVIFQTVIYLVTILVHY
jgi:hypothetical protein